MREPHQRFSLQAPNLKNRALSYRILTVWTRKNSEKARCWPNEPLRLVLLEACPAHSALGCLILHERIPHKSGPEILGHEHGDSGIDPDHVGVIPVGQRVEGVHKPILAPSLGIAIFDRAKNAHDRLR